MASNDEVEALTPGSLPRFTHGMLTALRCAALLSCAFFTGLLLYTCITDGSPFRSSLLTPWMVTTLFDYYLTLAPFLCWVALRHRRSPLSGLLLCVFFCCLGSSAVWSYLSMLFLRLRVGDSVTRLLTA